MRTLLTADWTNLAVVTFETDKKLLAKYIPYKTELNDWNGSYYLSLVGFQFSHPSINGIPMPFYRSFEELNLRFYIRYKSGNEWQKGVVFIKEVAPSPVIGMVARFLYRESFISLPMKHSIENTDTKTHTLLLENEKKLELPEINNRLNSNRTAGIIAGIIYPG
jgi:uncharacterized protein YqjF (DUF2071 family)